MSEEHTGDRAALSPQCSQDSCVTSTSASGEPLAGRGLVDADKTGDSVDSSHSLSDSEVSSSTSATNDRPWGLNTPIEDKNPFSAMSEEDLSQIDAVLSSEEGKLILQQTGRGGLQLDDMEEPPFSTMSSVLDPPMLADSSHVTEASSDPFLSTTLFDQNSLLNVALDPTEMPSVLLQEDELEFEQGFSDHAYCINNKRKNAAESDEKGDDVERSPSESQQCVGAESAASSGPVVSGRGRGRGRGRARTKPGARRSTRIQDNEEKHQAESIRQENLRNEQEALEALGGPPKIPAIKSGLKSYHMRNRSPRQKEGWAAILGKGKKGKKQKGAEGDSQDEDQTTEDPTESEQEEGEGEPLGDMLTREDTEVATEAEGVTIITISSQDSETDEHIAPAVQQTEFAEDEKVEEKEETEEEMPKPKGVQRKTRAVVTKSAGRGRGRGKIIKDEGGTTPVGRGRGRGRGRGGRKKAAAAEGNEGEPNGVGKGRGKKRAAKKAKAAAATSDSDAEAEEEGTPTGRKKPKGKKTWKADEEGECTEESPRKWEKGAKGKGTPGPKKGKGKKAKTAEEGGDEESVELVKKKATVIKGGDSSSSEDIPLSLMSAAAAAESQVLSFKKLQVVLHQVKEEGGVGSLVQREPILCELSAAGDVQGEEEVVEEGDEEAAEKAAKKRRMIRGGTNKADPDGEEEANADGDDDEDDEFEDDEDDADWGVEDDPDKLWCICRQPYSNRFMISCDTCEEWYHGSCVGITRTQGKAIEKSDGGWTCPPCCDKAKKKRRVAGSVQAEAGSELQVGELMEVGSTDVVLQDAVLQDMDTDQVGSSDDPHTPVKRHVVDGEDNEAEQISPSEKSRHDRHHQKDEELHQKFKKLKKERNRKLSGEGPAPPTPKKKKAVSTCIMAECGKAPREGSIYCSDECIVEHATESLKVLEKQNKKMYGNRQHNEAADGAQTGDRIVVMERASGKILTGPTAPTAASLQGWLEAHPTFEVVTGSNPATFHGAKKGKEKSKEKKGMEKEIQAIKQKWESKEKERRKNEKEQEDRERRQKIRDKVKAQIGESPDKKVENKNKPGQIKQSEAMASFGRIPKKAPVEKVRTSSSGARRGSSDTKRSEPALNFNKPPQHRALPQQTPAAETRPAPGDPSTPAAGPDPIRINVRKALKDALIQRADEADDVMVSSSEIKQIAMAIEEELFKIFGAVTPKYKNRYRSLVFNIRDQKNKGLFRKILNGTMNPARVASFSADELASRELARWREMEVKHHLQLIEKTEKEAAMEAAHLVKKTHKGDLSVGEEDLSDLTQGGQPHGCGGHQYVAGDTTDMHEHHLFDKNCKICTGKVAPPSVQQQQAAPEVKKVKFSAYMSARGRAPSDPRTRDESTEKREPNVSAGFYREIDPTAMHNLPPFASYLRGDPRDPRMARLVQKPPPPLAQPVVKTEAPVDVSAVINKTLALVATALDSSVVTSTTAAATVSSPDSALQSGLDKKPVFPSSPTFIWKGGIFMADLGKFTANAFRVSGDVDGLDKDLPDTIEIKGRIMPDQIWEYITRIRHSATRDLIIIRFQPASDAEKSNYVQLYSYLSGRNRCGVAGHYGKAVKDMYIVPLAAHSRIPTALLPFEGPGLGTNRPHMLLGVIVRQGLRRLIQPATTAETLNLAEIGLQRKQPTPSKPAQKTPSRRDPRRDPRLARQQEAQAAPPAPPAPIRGTMIPPQPDRPNTPPLHLMPPDQPYAGDLAASAYGTTATQSDASSDEDDTHDMIVKQFGKSGAVLGSETPNEETNVKDTAAKKAGDDGDKPYSPSMVDMEDDDAEAPYEPGDDIDLDLPLPVVTPDDTPPATQTTPAPPAGLSTAPPAGLGTAPLAGLGALNIAAILGQVSTATNSSEMTAAVVATLAATASSSGLEEQKMMLLELTKKIDEQKKMLEIKKSVVKPETDAETEVTSGSEDAEQKATKMEVDSVPNIPLPVPATPMAQEQVKQQSPPQSQHVAKMSKQAENPDKGGMPGVSIPLPEEHLTNFALKRISKKMGMKMPDEPPKTEPAAPKLAEKITEVMEAKDDVSEADSLESKQLVAGEACRVAGAADVTDKTPVSAPSGAVEAAACAHTPPPASLPILPEAIQQLFSQHTLQDLIGLVKHTGITAADTTTNHPPTTVTAQTEKDREQSATSDVDKTDDLEEAMNNPGGMFEIMRRNTEAIFGKTTVQPKPVEASPPPSMDLGEGVTKDESAEPVWKPSSSHIPPELAQPSHDQDKEHAPWRKDCGSRVTTAAAASMLPAVKLPPPTLPVGPGVAATYVPPYTPASTGSVPTAAIPPSTASKLPEPLQPPTTTSTSTLKANAFGLDEMFLTGKDVDMRVLPKVTLAGNNAPTSVTVTKGTSTGAPDFHLKKDSVPKSVSSTTSPLDLVPSVVRAKAAQAAKEGAKPSAGIRFSLTPSKLPQHSNVKKGTSASEAFELPRSKMKIELKLPKFLEKKKEAVVEVPNLLVAKVAAAAETGLVNIGCGKVPAAAAAKAPSPVDVKAPGVSTVTTAMHAVIQDVEDPKFAKAVSKSRTPASVPAAPSAAAALDVLSIPLPAAPAAPLPATVKKAAPADRRADKTRDSKQSPLRSQSKEKSKPKRSHSKDRGRRKSRSRSKERGRREKRSRSQSQDKHSRSQSKDRRSRSRSRDKSRKRSRSRSRERRRDRSRKSPNRRRSSPFKSRDRRRSPERGRRGTSPERSKRRRSRSSSRERRPRDRDDDRRPRKGDDEKRAFTQQGHEQDKNKAWTKGPTPADVKPKEDVVCSDSDKAAGVKAAAGAGLLPPQEAAPTPPAMFPSGQPWQPGRAPPGPPPGAPTATKPPSLNISTTFDKPPPGFAGPRPRHMQDNSSQARQDAGRPGPAWGTPPPTSSSPTKPLPTQPDSTAQRPLADLRRLRSKEQDDQILTCDVDLRGPPPAKRPRGMEDSPRDSLRDRHMQSRSDSERPFVRPVRPDDALLPTSTRPGDKPNLHPPSWDRIPSADSPKGSKDMDERIPPQLRGITGDRPPRGLLGEGRGSLLVQSPNSRLGEGLLGEGPGSSDRDLRISNPRELHKLSSPTLRGPAAMDPRQPPGRRPEPVPLSTTGKDAAPSSCSSLMRDAAPPQSLAASPGRPAVSQQELAKPPPSMLPLTLSDKDWEQLRKVQEQLTCLPPGALQLPAPSSESGFPALPVDGGAGRAAWPPLDTDVPLPRLDRPPPGFSRPPPQLENLARRPADNVLGRPGDGHGPPQDVDHRLPRSLAGFSDRQHGSDVDQSPRDYGDNRPYSLGDPRSRGGKPHRDPPPAPPSRGLPNRGGPQHNSRGPPPTDREYSDVDHRTEFGTHGRRRQSDDQEHYPPSQRRSDMPRESEPKSEQYMAEFPPEQEFEDFDMRSQPHGPPPSLHGPPPSLHGPAPSLHGPPPPLGFGRGAPPPPFPSFGQGPRMRMSGPPRRGRGAMPPRMRGMRPARPPRY